MSTAVIVALVCCVIIVASVSCIFAVGLFPSSSGKPRKDEPGVRRKYTESDRTLLVGTVVRAQEASPPECKNLCDAEELCDWAEMHAGTCVLKNIKYPDECTKGSAKLPAKRCADGFKDNVTLYNPKNSDGTTVLPNLDKINKALSAFEEEAKCDTKCKILDAVSILNIILTVIPIGGTLMTGVELGLMGAEIGMGIAGGKESAVRRKFMYGGVVGTNMSDKITAAALCRKQFRVDDKRKGSIMMNVRGELSKETVDKCMQETLAAMRN